ncbi:MAG: response regulator [Pelovirga sp.]
MSLSVMFIDDEKPILNSLKRILHPVSDDWKVTYADSAEGALIALKIVPVDAIVVDMCMPGMNGFELLNVISEQYPDMVRVMMTGRTEYEIYRNGREISHYFLWKPVKAEAIKTLLQRISDQYVSSPGDS